MASLNAAVHWFNLLKSIFLTNKALQPSWEGGKRKKDKENKLIWAITNEEIQIQNEKEQN